MQLFPSNFHPKRKQICRGQPTFSFGGGSAGRQGITPSLISLSNVIMNIRTVMMKMIKQMRTVNMMLVMTTSPNIQHKIKIKKNSSWKNPLCSHHKKDFFLPDSLDPDTRPNNLSRPPPQKWSGLTSRLFPLGLAAPCQPRRSYWACPSSGQGRHKTSQCPRTGFHHSWGRVWPSRSPPSWGVPPLEPTCSRY